MIYLLQSLSQPRMGVQKHGVNMVRTHVPFVFLKKQSQSLLQLLSFSFRPGESIGLILVLSDKEISQGLDQEEQRLKE